MNTMKEFFKAMSMNFKSQGWWNIVWVLKLIMAGMFFRVSKISFKASGAFVIMARDAGTTWKDSPLAGFTLMMGAAIFFICWFVFYVSVAFQTAFSPLNRERERRKIRAEIEAYLKEKEE